MAKLVLGLDIGITSVGWGLVDIDNNDIIKKGVRLFPEGTAADNLKRRTKRGSRRLKRRRQQRIIDLKNLLQEHKIITDDFKPLSNPYEIRVKGLKQQLTNEELATAFLHIVKRRGSILDVVEDNSEKEKENESTKAVLSQNSRLLREKGYHICELQLERLKSGESVRGTNNNFKTEEYLKEAKAILNNQSISEELKEEIINLIQRKREYYEGPGSEKSPTPYGRWFYNENGEIKYMSMIDKMRGKCSIFKDEPCAPKMSYKADLFNLLNDLNNLNVDGEEITKEQKLEIIEEYINKKGQIKPDALSKYLGVPEELITGFRIDKNEKPLLTEFKGYKKLLSVVNNKKNPLNKKILENKDTVDKIIEILTRVKGVEDRIEEIKKIDSNLFDDETAKVIANISGITGYHSISFKAMDMIIPEMLETNDNQMQVLSRIGMINKEAKETFKGLKNIPFDDSVILSPVAKRAQNEALKIINAIRKRYGELDSIVIETARDKNSLEERKRIQDEQKRGKQLNDKCEDLARGVRLNGKLRQKLRLYMEQDAICLYSGKPIDLYRLLHDPEAYEIDHIIPISISMDDSMNNKVLVLRDFNHKKGNMTPFKFFASGQATGWTYNEFKTYCLSLRKNNHLNRKKLNNLLFEEDINKHSVREKFVERNLVDTRYASRVILNTLTNYFSANNINTKVHTVRGAITGVFRKKAGLVKNRDYFYHHIVDALIIAGIKKQGYLNKLLVNYQDNVNFDPETGEVLEVIDDAEFFDRDYLKYISQLKEINECIVYDEEIKISHKVDKKPNRQFTDETIYGVRKRDDGLNWRIGRYKDIYGVDGEKLYKDILEGRDDKILMSKVDPKTYGLLKSIAINTTLDKEKGEKNPFAKYKEEHGYIRKVSKNNKGPIVKSVKYYHERLGNHVDITHKYIQNPKDTRVVLLQVSPYRTDFYRAADGTYKFVTIRYANLSKDKDGFYIEKGWYEEELAKKEIDDNFEFVFSLNRNEYIEIQKQEKDFRETKLFRFVATNNDDKNVIEVKPLHCHKDKNKAQIMITIGRKIIGLRKFHVDVLGNIYETKKEKLRFRIK